MKIKIRRGLLMIKHEKIKLVWQKGNKKFYISNGCTFTNYGDVFEVNISDLPKGSCVQVEYICDYCEGKNQIEQKSKIKEYKVLLRCRKLTNKDCCGHKDCKYKKLSEELSLKSIINNGSFAKLFSELASEWNYDKNDGNPNDYSYGSPVMVWWSGKCGHEWEDSILNRTSKGRGCPYCSGRKLHIDNSLALKFPRIAEEWHPTKNGKLTPYNFTKSSRKRIWWICKNGHEWSNTINSRTNNLSDCPECSLPKGEKRIRDWLINNDIVFSSQKEFKGLIGINGGLLSYDFYLSEQNILIEYQGEFHDGKANEYVKENLEKQQEHDIRKKEFAKKHNIHLLEIWYWDFNNIEEILSKELSKFNLLQ
jgi:hypothetical protein